MWYVFLSLRDEERGCKVFMVVFTNAPKKLAQITVICNINKREY